MAYLPEQCTQRVTLRQIDVSDTVGRGRIE